MRSRGRGDTEHGVFCDFWQGISTIATTSPVAAVATRAAALITASVSAASVATRAAALIAASVATTIASTAVGTAALTGATLTTALTPPSAATPAPTTLTAVAVPATAATTQPRVPQHEVGTRRALKRSGGSRCARTCARRRWHYHGRLSGHTG